MTHPGSADALDTAALNDLRSMLGDALAEIVHSFLDGLDNEVQAIQEALVADKLTLRVTAHSLKGSAGNMGARALAALASSIEKAAMDGDMRRCAELIAGLPGAAVQARQALTAYLAQH